MSKGIIDEVIGGLAVFVGVLLEFVPGAQFLGALLITAGVGMLLTGIGTLISGSGGQGVVTNASASVQPNAPWVINYGRSPEGGTLVRLQEDGE